MVGLSITQTQLFYASPACWKMGGRDASAFKQQSAGKQNQFVYASPACWKMGGRHDHVGNQPLVSKTNFLCESSLLENGWPHHSNSNPPLSKTKTVFFYASPACWKMGGRYASSLKSSVLENGWSGCLITQTLIRH